MRRRAARTDGNQTQIAGELRDMGFSVCFAHQLGQGFPDLVIGKQGVTMLVELKMPGKKLTKDEVLFFDTWRGSAVVATTSDEIHAAFMDILSGTDISRAMHQAN